MRSLCTNLAKLNQLIAKVHATRLCRHRQCNAGDGEKSNVSTLEPANIFSQSETFPFFFLLIARRTGKEGRKGEAIWPALVYHPVSLALLMRGCSGSAVLEQTVEGRFGRRMYSHRYGLAIVLSVRPREGQAGMRAGRPPC